jgi:type I restriction enzyme M protein
MTPKGGITPHKRFSVSANRSEILFVDYIKEHLNIGGRAGIVVPDGVVNGITTASKILRKSLLENGLFSVVSLPAGVFNPYSGVKTYILFLDKDLSRSSDSILFIKINNDGFDLGANRRKIEKDDLPFAVKAINDYKNKLIAKQSYQNIFSNDISVTLVKKQVIQDTKDCNLSSERYLEQEISKNNKWPLVLLGDVCDFEGGSQPPKAKFIYEPKDGYVKFIQIRDFGNNGIDTYIPVSARNRLCKNEDVLIARYGASLGRICSGLEGAYNVALLKTIPDENKILREYLYYLLKSSFIQNRILQLGNRAAQAGIRPDDLKATKIFLPSISEQKKIIVSFKKEEAEIQKLKQQIKSHENNIDKAIERLCN